MIGPELIESYQRELTYLREQGKAFAELHPNIAEKLGLSEKECKDPYVERLLEGVAFLTAKLNLKIDSEFPQFTQHLLEILAPELLAPIPSMAVFQFEPDFSEGGLVSGPVIPKNTPVRSLLPRQGQTACEFRTGQALRLWPIQVSGLTYTNDIRRLRAAAKSRQLKSALSIKLSTVNAIPWQALDLDNLVFYLDLQNPLLDKLLQLMFHADSSIQVFDSKRQQAVQPASVRSEPLSFEVCGFETDEALFPQRPGLFSGYRLLLEFFRFPERFQFIRLKGLRDHLSKVTGTEIELMLGFNEYNDLLEDLCEHHICLNAVPAINLFEKHCDHVNLKSRDNAHHLIVDRSCQFDYEVHTLLSMQGYKADQAKPYSIPPYYDAMGGLTPLHRPAYTLSRVPLKRESPKQPEANTGYVGTEVHIQLNDVQASGSVNELAYQRVGVTALCTNRDLPYQLQKHNKSFRMLNNEPVAEQVKCLVGPTKPRRPLAQQQIVDRSAKKQQSPSAWQAITFLSQNSMGLRSSQNQAMLLQLQRLLSLYAAPDNGTAKLVDGLVGFQTRPMNRLDNSLFPPCLERGIAVEVSIDEACFHGFSPMLFSRVLSHLLSHFSELNSFVELTLVSPQRDEITRWPMKPGKGGLIR